MEENIDLVLVREKMCPFYRYQKDGKLLDDEDGKMVLDEKRSTFAEQLVLGRVPDWLKPVKLSSVGDYYLFEVVRPETSVPAQPDGQTQTP
jgi:hypothetical protein